MSDENFFLKHTYGHPSFIVCVKARNPGNFNLQVAYYSTVHEKSCLNRIKKRLVFCYWTLNSGSSGIGTGF